VKDFREDNDYIRLVCHYQWGCEKSQKFIRVRGSLERANIWGRISK